MERNGDEHWFSKVAGQAANGSGRHWAFGLAAAFVLVWLMTGPLFRFSDTWQLVMNTLSSIVTFLMVFLIQPRPVIISISHAARRLYEFCSGQFR